MTKPGQVHEDISTVDYLTGGPRHVTSESRPSLSVDPVTGRAATGTNRKQSVPTLGDELEVTLLTTEVHLAPGSQGRIEVRLANLVARRHQGRSPGAEPVTTPGP